MLIDKLSRHKLCNKYLMLDWTICTIVLIGAYIGEYISGRRTLEYVKNFSTLLITIYFVAVGAYIAFRNNSRWFKYTFTVLWIIFYSYIIATGKTVVVAVYMIPILTMIASYANAKLISIVSAISIILVVVSTQIRYLTGQLVGIEITNSLIVIGAFVIWLLCSVHAAKVDRMTIDELKLYREKAMKDTLTKCYNRSIIEEMRDSGIFEDNGTSLLLGDVNDFKKYNDTYGHNIGDIILQRIGKHLVDGCEGIEGAYPIRVGGDEFVVVCKDTDANKILTYIEQKLEEDTHLHTNGYSVTVGFGKASTSDLTEKNFTNLYESADKHMYARKDYMKGI